MGPHPQDHPRQHAGSETIGIAAQLYQACSELLDSATSSLKQSTVLSKLERRAFVRIRQSLFLWGRSHNAAGAQLDLLLQESRPIQQVVVRALKLILKRVAYELLPQLLAPQIIGTAIDREHITRLVEQSKFSNRDPDDEQDGSSSSGSDSSDNDKETPSIQQVFARLRNDIRCLTDMSSLIDSLALELEKKESITPVLTISDILPHQYYSNCIRERFPEAPVELIDYFGKVTFERYQKLLQQRLHIEQQQEGLEVLEVTSSKKDDSGYGSLPTTSSYAPTLASSAVSSLAEGMRSKYPPLPDGASEGKPFECLACGRQIRASHKHEWRNHLIQDLKSYSCIFPPCSFGHFDSRRDWSNHLLLDHSEESIWQTCYCQLCNICKPGEMHAFLTHLARHLEEISLLALPRDIESEYESSSEENKDPLTQMDASEADAFVTWLDNNDSKVDGKLSDGIDARDMYPDQFIYPTDHHGGPYICHTCDKKFETPGDRNHHEITHGERTLQCPECLKSFLWQKDLSRHMTNHNKARNFACIFCGKSFTRRDNCRRHQEKRHPIASQSSRSSQLGV